MNELLEGIAADPRICLGKSCIRGTRIRVSLLLDFPASGASVEENYRQYR